MGINIAKLKERFDKKSAEKADRLNMKDGDNELRLLPPSLEYLTGEVDYICFDYLMHFNLGIEGNKTAEPCPKTYGKDKKCPICEAVYKLYKTNKPEDKALAGEIRSKVRHIFNAIDLGDLEKGIQTLEVGPKIYEEVFRFVSNPKWGDLLDLDTGRNITIVKTPAKESTTGYVDYALSPDPDQTSIREKLPKNFKEGIAKLKMQLPNPKTYEVLKAILEGEDTEKIAEVSGASKASKAPKVVEESVDVSDVAEESSEEKPECFAQEYGPKRDKCIKCSVKAECRDKYLEV